MRRRFMWRFTAVVLVFVGLLGTLVALVAWAVGSVLKGPLGLAATALLPLVVVIVLGLLIVRLVRGAGAPVADLVEAAGRVESGDYAVRVRARGPRELRSLAAAFNAMSARLEQTDVERSRLLADVSHELRTPLTVMQGTLEGMLDGLYPADEAHMARVLEETRIMSRLIDDLRTLSSAEAGSLSLHREPTSLGRLLTDATAAFRSQADGAGVTLEVHLADPLPTLDLDPERVRQVVANLLTNALRHTPRGGRIEVSATHAVGTVTVNVSDTGSGMPPDMLERIFERFYRAPESRGSGLGLPIARELVRAHGGEISAESQPGRGTTMRFTLPATG